MDRIDDAIEFRSESSEEEAEQLAWLALRLTPGLGNRSILRLIQHFGSARAILQAGPKELSTVSGLREKAILALQKKETLRPVAAEWRLMRKEKIRLVHLNGKDYPANLAAIPDPPPMLFVQGALEARDLVSIAVVGSRAASLTGMGFTERLSMDLAQYGVTVVSGLAVGIDSAAHRGALKGKGRTLAVLGCGLDIDYPRGNGRLKQEIAQSGALITEFPLTTPPAAIHFPMRNRIISGLSLGVVVVEAAQRSGSLITARLALEQGREVFAVPGLARNFRSVGPHRLLKEGAKLVECAEDILEEIRPSIRRSQASRPAGENREEPKDAATDEEAALLKALDHTPRHIDDVCRSVEWPVSKVMAVLLTLELKGIIRQLPGKYFIHDGSRTG